MKLLFILLLCISQLAKAQAIKIIDVESRETENLITKKSYDSTSNYIDNASLYVGQKFYLHPYQKRKESKFWKGYNENGYEDFYKLPYSNSEDALSRRNLYGLFNVISITNSNSNNFIKLFNSETNDTIYYKHYVGEVAKEKFPFVVLGYLEKIRKTDIGKVYEIQYTKYGVTKYYNEKGWLIQSAESNPREVIFYDYRTKKKINLAIGDRYVVNDVAIGSDGNILWIIKNLKGEEVAFNQLDFNSEFTSIAFTPEWKALQIKRANEALIKLKQRQVMLTTKYGSAIASLIIQHQVKVGMTKEMCRSAWGEPEHINTTTTRSVLSEQWVYDLNRYLYFTNGKLSAIQD